ncbi:hypothetical protein [Desulfobacula sp.]|uniref:hypothetical protein n=1 Tax=Desulfobacula sp. TaxID=2593537 RepID=UPI00260B5286|nr:hypothetical protein [Desulfobacula sp.]
MSGKTDLRYAFINMMKNINKTILTLRQVKSVLILLGIDPANLDMERLGLTPENFGISLSSMVPGVCSFNGAGFYSGITVSSEFH